VYFLDNLHTDAPNIDEDLAKVSNEDNLLTDECHTRFSVENRMHLICVPGSQFHTYDRLMSVISQDIAQKRTEKVY
jgi:deoxyhypusine synthase